MESYGLVFCGGGGRGAYQIGVWKALDQLGKTKHIKAVSGTSAGALNAALFVSKKQKDAEEIWTSLKQGDIIDLKDLNPLSASVIGSNGLKSTIMTCVGGLVPTHYFSLLFKLIISLPQLMSVVKLIKNEGFFSQKGLKRVITENNVANGVKRSDIACFACRHRRSMDKNLSLEYVRLNDLENENDIVEALADSSCLPIFFRAQKHDGKKYWDGGLNDNCPIKPVYDMGIRKLIVVMLRPDAKIKPEDYPGAEITVIRPSRSIYLGHTGIRAVDDGLTDFKGKNAQVRIDLGYSDAMDVFKGSGHTASKPKVKSGNISNIISRYKNDISSEQGRFSCGNTIDTIKVANAIKRYARDLEAEDVLAIYDDTLKRNGKGGFVITKDSIVISLFDLCTIIPFSTINAVEIKQSKLPGSSNDPYSADIVIYTKDGKRESKYFYKCNHHKLKAMIDEIRKAI